MGGGGPATPGAAESIAALDAVSVVAALQPRSETGTGPAVGRPGTPATPVAETATVAPQASAPSVASADPAPRPVATPPVRRAPAQQRPPESAPRVVETAPRTAPEPAPLFSQQAEQPAAQASAPAAVVAAPKPAPSALQSPTELCGRRVLIALWNCIDRQCREPELRSHPECVKLREDRERSVRGRF
jgi:outer membrane biosynthesis protein TonB